MKLKNSEKKLLGILGIAVFSYIFFTYLFFPTLDTNALIKAEYAAVDQEYQALLKSHLTNNQLKEVLTKASGQYKALETQLPPQIHQEEAILFLTNLADTHEMKVDSYNFSFTETATPVAATEETVQKAPVDEVLKEFQKIVSGDQNANLDQFKDKIYQVPAEQKDLLNQYEKDLKYFNVSITLEGNYNKFKNYINALETYKSKIIIKQINLSKSLSARADVIGTLTISYPIYYDQETLTPYDWDFEKAPINLNPFEYEVFTLQSVDPGLMSGDQTTSPAVTPAETDSQTSAYNSADFYAVLKPANSDANTLTMGKTPYHHSELYADNDGVENATLKIRKSGGKLQYQYATSLQTYPKEGEWKDFELMNKNQIVLEIQSMARLPQNDQAGVLLSISNDTDVPLTVYVYNEDKARPRLTVNKASGKISIKQL